MAAQPQDVRPGFTLIELLVVISIVGVLAALAVLVVPRFSESQRISLGASQIQGWLAIAKQRAFRDKLPRGIRIHRRLAATSNPASPPPAEIDFNYAIELEYIEQPDDASVGTIYQSTALTSPPAPTPGAPNTLLRLDHPNRYGAVIPALPAGMEARQFASPGDYLVVGNDVHTIFRAGYVPLQPALPPAAPTNTPVIVQAHEIEIVPFNGQGLARTIAPGSSIPYRVMRQPRPLEGEPRLQVPTDVGIDLSMQLATPVPPLPTPPNFRLTYSQLSPDVIPQAAIPAYYDIMFSPSGGLTGVQANTAVVLWVRDISPSTPTAFDNEPTLITINPRTGAIGAHPVNPGAGKAQWYAFTRDGRSSGM